jgi:hypothetical protein
MRTWQAGTNKAIQLWRDLPVDQRAALAAAATSQPGTDFLERRVIELDRQRQQPPAIVSAFFQMDVSIDSRHVYLFAPEDIA